MVKKSKKVETKNPNFYAKLIDSFKLIRSNKLLFIGIILLTILYISVSVYIMAFYWVEAAAHQQAVLNYIESIPLDNPTASPLGNDPLQIYNEISATKKALLLMGMFLLLTTFLIDGASWLLTKLMRSKDNILEFLAAYTLIFTAFTILFGSLIYFTFKISFADALSDTPNMLLNIVGWLILLILVYFYFIFIGVATNSELKEIPKKALKTSIKVLTTLPTYALSLALISLFVFLIVYFIEGNFFILIFSVIMLFLSLSYSKVLFSTEFD